MYGPDVAIFFMFESQEERHSFCGIETLNGYMYSRVDGLSTDPRVWGVTVTLLPPNKMALSSTSP